MELLLEYGYDGTIDASSYLLDYRNEQFPFGTTTSVSYINDLQNDSDDGDFWEYSGSGSDYLSPQDLYLHVWVSLYGGAGFTNIYWSPLKYLGSINLF